MLGPGAKMLPVRTTIRIDDELYRQVKARAASEGRTVAAVIEDSVRTAMLGRTSVDVAPFEIVASGRGGLRPGVDLESNASVLEVLDDNVDLSELK